MDTHMNDWTVMTEEEKYAEWSTYVARISGGVLSDYSTYCEWMDEWVSKDV